MKNIASLGKPKAFRTVAEVASELEVCEKTVRRWIDRGELRVHRIGRVIRVAPDDFDAFIRSKRS